MVSKVLSSTNNSIEETLTKETSSLQSKKRKLSAVQRIFTKHAEREQKRRKNDRKIKKSVQAYRLQTSQLMMSLQLNDVSSLHALTNAYVTRHVGDPKPPPALPEISKIPAITLSDTSESTDREDVHDSEEEPLNDSNKTIKAPEPIVE